MTRELTTEQVQDLRRAFELTEDSGRVDHHGIRRILQMFNMNPTAEDVTGRYSKHNKDPASGITFDDFLSIFRDYLELQDRVPHALTETLGELFDGPVSKEELRKILTEMGSEPFDPDEVNEVMDEISFDKNGQILQKDLKEFLLNRVDLSVPAKPNTADESIAERESPEVHVDISDDEF